MGKTSLFSRMFSGKDKQKLNLESLCPTSDAENNQVYNRALLTAIEDENVTNIALTGSYGSGKSSIIQTFLKMHSEYKSLNISLANFNENPLVIEKRAGIKNLQKTDQHLELSVLQQMFYQVSNRKLPDSRFKRINNLTKLNLLLLAFFGLLFFVSILFVFEPKFVTITNLWNAIDWNKHGDYIKYISLFVFASGLFCILLKSFRFLNSYHLRRFNLKNVEIELDCQNERSILNRYLDEIIYFFKKNNFSVVVIEDLDRFQNPEIFIKLREINFAINKTKRYKSKKVKFVYAVRDNLFDRNNRTKFFDIIIPVIPIVDFKNSKDKFNELFEKVGLKNIDNYLVKSTAYFIPDLRVLKNIFNEFLIYKLKLVEELDSSKLLALIIYKNIFPDDFSLISKNRSIINEIFNENKIKLVKKLTKEKAERIDELDKLVKSIQHSDFQSEKQLRIQYVGEIWNQLENPVFLTIANKDYTFKDLCQEGPFSLIKGQVIALYKRHHSQARLQQANASISFESIENSIDPRYSYEERLSQIGTPLQAYFSEKEKLKREIESIEHLSLSSLLEQDEKFLEREVEMLATDKLAMILLSKGFISEDYFRYVSIFHSGSIDRGELGFVLSCLNREALPFDYPLKNLDNIVGEELELVEFGQKEVLNVYVLDYLMENSLKYEKKLELFLQQISTESKRAISFLHFYFERQQNIEAFILSLSSYWENMWAFISNDISISNEPKWKYFQKILEIVDLDTIKNMNVNSCVYKDISVNFDRLCCLDMTHTPKIEELIARFEIFFTKLGTQEKDSSILDFVYTNNWYELNINNIETIIKAKGKKIDDFDQKFWKSNYKTICESSCTQLIDYVNGNIDFYIEHIYLELPHNTVEDSTIFVELLNSELKDEHKYSLMQKIETKIEDISFIDSIELQSELWAQNRILETWENVYVYFTNTNGINDILVDFLNMESTYLSLSKQPPDTLISLVGNDAIQLYNSIAATNALTLESYKAILTNIDALMLSDIPTDFSENKIAFLIENKKINLTLDNYYIVKDNYAKLNIKLIEVYGLQINSFFDSIVFDLEDIKGIFISNNIDNELKVSILKRSTDVEGILEDQDLNNRILSILATTIFTFDSKNEFFSFIVKLFINTDLVEDKIRFILLNCMIFPPPISAMNELFDAMGMPYKKITKRLHVINLKNNKLNQKLVRDILTPKWIKKAPILKDDEIVFKVRNI